MSNIQKQHKISPAIAWLTIQKFIIFYCPLDGEHTISRISDSFLFNWYVFPGILLAWTFAVIPAIFRLLPPPGQNLTIFILLYRVFLFSVSNVRWNMYFCLFYSLFCSFCSLFHFIVQTFFRIFLSCMTCFCPIRLVQRFVNNYTNRVGCGFECAGIKTQA